MSLFWSKFPISETKKYNNKMKTCKYEHKIISPFSSRHLGWIPLLMWTKTTLYFTPFTISILFFPDTCPECRFSFRVFLFCVFFKCFPCFLLVQTVEHFPAPTHPHTYGQFGALSQAPTQTPHKRFVWFVLFSPTN